MVDRQIRETQGRGGWAGTQVPGAGLTAFSVLGSPPRDCLDVLLSGQQEDGIYSVFPTHYPAGFQVYCDMRTDGGGWTVSLPGRCLGGPGGPRGVAHVSRGALSSRSPSLLPSASGPHLPAPNRTQELYTLRNLRRASRGCELSLGALGGADFRPCPLPMEPPPVP